MFSTDWFKFVNLADMVGVHFNLNVYKVQNRKFCSLQQVSNYSEIFFSRYSVADKVCALMFLEAKIFICRQFIETAQNMYLNFYKVQKV